MTTKLTTTNHDRDVAGLKYIYPVISRRAGGLSIGINVNTNNACNWRCLYCQVPGLSVGAAPAVDWTLLETELRWFLQQVKCGEFYRRYNVPQEQQGIKDIAISGNGEPTSVKDFPRLVDLLGKVLQEAGVCNTLKKVLITNGSLIHKQDVQQGLKEWHALGGEIWFKLDRASRNERELLNNTQQSNEQVLRNLRLAASICVTKIQTCLLHYKGVGWAKTEQHDYIQLLSQLHDLPYLQQVMLYTLARPSMQPEAVLLQAMPLEEMQLIAAEIEKLGLSVLISE